MAGRHQIQKDQQYIEARSCAEPNTGCWLWELFCGINGGYGQINIAGKTVRAHRLAYEVFIGPIPQGASVLHKCDTPSCVNPAHLFLGTHKENMADMRRKGRATKKGRATYGGALISVDVVLEIWRSKESARVVAAKHGISKSIVWKIRRGETWEHITRGLKRGT